MVRVVWAAVFGLIAILRTQNWILVKGLTFLCVSLVRGEYTSRDVCHVGQAAADGQTVSGATPGHQQSGELHSACPDQGRPQEVSAGTNGVGVARVGLW